MCRWCPSRYRDQVDGWLVHQGFVDDSGGLVGASDRTVTHVQQERIAANGE